MKQSANQSRPLCAPTGQRRHVWPASRLAAIALAVLAVLILAGSLVLYALTRQNLAENGGQDVIIFASFVTVGLVIAWHRPGNPIGWILLAGVDFQGLAIVANMPTIIRGINTRRKIAARHQMRDLAPWLSVLLEVRVMQEPAVGF